MPVRPEPLVHSWTGFLLFGHGTRAAGEAARSAVALSPAAILGHLLPEAAMSALSRAIQAIKNLGTKKREPRTPPPPRPSGPYQPGV